MTDLTEQWKRGEFIICNAGKCQYYYVRNEEQQEVIKTEYCLFDDNTPNWQILASVPSYEEWKALNGNMDSVMQTNQALCKKLAELKELLKECFEYIDWTDGTGSPISQQKLLDKIDEALR